MEYAISIIETIFVFFVCILLCVSCATNILCNGTTDTDIRDNLNELQTKQSDSASTSARAAEKSTGLAERLTDSREQIEGINNVTESIRNGIERRESNNQLFESIIAEIRTQHLTDDNGNTRPATNSSTPEN